MIVLVCFFTTLIDFFKDNFELMVSFLGNIIVAFIAFWAGSSTQRRNYRDEYYKTVIQKRIEAYQFVEKQLEVMRMTVFDECDKKQYHAFFDNSGDKIINYRRNLYQAIARCTWLSSKMMKALASLDEFFFEIDGKIEDDKDANIEIGKQYFSKLKAVQIRISEILITDTEKLYEVKSFLKSKRESYQGKPLKRK